MKPASSADRGGCFASLYSWLLRQQMLRDWIAPVPRNWRREFRFPPLVEVKSYVHVIKWERKCSVCQSSRKLAPLPHSWRDTDFIMLEFFHKIKLKLRMDMHLIMMMMMMMMMMIIIIIIIIIHSKHVIWTETGTAIVSMITVGQRWTDVDLNSVSRVCPAGWFHENKKY
jgi:hypothetical protein